MSQTIINLISIPGGWQPLKKVFGMQTETKARHSCLSLGFYFLHRNYCPLYRLHGHIRISDFISRMIIIQRWIDKVHFLTIMLFRIPPFKSIVTCLSWNCKSSFKWIANSENWKNINSLVRKSTKTLIWYGGDYGTLINHVITSLVYCSNLLNVHHRHDKNDQT